MTTRRSELLAMVGLVTCLVGTAISATGIPNLVPWPQTVQLDKGRLHLTPDSRIVVSDKRLLDLAAILSCDIYRTTGLQLETRSGQPEPGDILLAFGTAQPTADTNESYAIAVTDRVRVSADSYRGVVWGASALVQAMDMTDGRCTLPKMRIQDAPAHAFRCIQICTKHQVSREETYRAAIDLCRLYRVNYVTYHPGSYQTLWTLCPPFRVDPLDPGSWDAGANWTAVESAERVAYASRRGVTIIPMCSLNFFWGDSRRWLFKAFPEIFDTPAYRAYDEQQFTLLDDPNYWKAIDRLLARTAAFHPDTPWIHMGAVDGEVRPFGGVAPEKEFMRKHDLRGSGDVWAWVLKKAHALAKAHGKRSMAYEGVNRGAAQRVGLPRDIVFLEYQYVYYPPQEMADDGFQIVNFSWQPMYLCAGRATLEETYAWDLLRWQNNYFGIAESRLRPTPNVIGSMMATWEESDSRNIYLIRRHAAAMSERTWNPEAARTFEDFKTRLDACDGKLQQMLYPANVTIEGLKPGNPRGSLHTRTDYGGELTIRADPVLPGTVRYTMDSGQPETDWQVYREPLKARPAYIKMALFDAGGQRIGDFYERTLHYRPINITVDGLIFDRKFQRNTEIFGRELQVNFTTDDPDLTIHCRVDPPAGYQVQKTDPVWADVRTFRKPVRIHARALTGANAWRGPQEVVRASNEGFVDHLLVGAEARSGPMGGEAVENMTERVAIDGLCHDREVHFDITGPAWFMATLHAPVVMDRINYIGYWDGSRYYQYTIEVSTDGMNWTKVIDASENTAPLTPKGYAHTFEPIAARFVRINLLKNSANPGVHIVELQAFGPDAERALH